MKFTGKQSIKEIIASMTVEEKLTILTGCSHFKTPALEKYGIPPVYYLDGATGANFIQMVTDIQLASSKPSPENMGELVRIISCLLNPAQIEELDGETREQVDAVNKTLEEYLPGGLLPGCFPPGILLGASWDSDSIYECGKALAREADYYGIDVLLGPNVNIHRDPLGGRLFEGYSEDPFLVSSLAPAFVKGVQSEGIAANIKHFAANNQETNRSTVNEHIPERALREIYFPGFKACVQEGGGKTVMSAYNAINGEYCAQNRWLLTDVLRGEWGFEGFVVSDWGAAYDQVKALKAGNDVDMPGPRPVDGVARAVKDGELDEAQIDLSLERYLNVLAESTAVKGHKYTAIDREVSRKAAYNSVKEGMVLLKNENNALPLSYRDSVCFFGQKSKKFIESGGGSANVITGGSTGMYDCMVQKIGGGNVTFEDIRPETDAVVITVGIIGSEGFDRAEMDVGREDKAMLTGALAKAKQALKKTIVILNVCGPVDVSDYAGLSDAILCVFIPGMEGGRAAADALLGEINPSGKLPVTFPKRYADCPSSIHFPGRNQETWYGEGIFVGYRYYDYEEIEPRYPFGHGLSYTTFETGGARLSNHTLRLGRQDEVRLTVKIKNTGDMAGKEVVQIYIGQDRSTLTKPRKELKAFKKIGLVPGEGAELEFVLTERMLQSYDERTKQWVAEPGLYRIYIGTSSRRIAQELEFTAEGWNPLGITGATLLGEIAIRPGAWDKLLEYCPEGAIDSNTAELMLMLRSSEPLAHFWASAAKPLLGMDEKEKEAYYERMLKELNDCR